MDNQIMEIPFKNNVLNGIGGNYFTNAHLSYKGKSIIIDYEHILRSYGIKDNEWNGLIPVEVYPTKDGDAFTFFVHEDNDFKKADLEEIMLQLDAME